MIRASLLFTTALVALPLAPAFAQDGKDVTIVLGEDIDLVEPCMATRSNIGRIIMQNVNETLTQYDVKGGQGVMPRLAEVVGGPGQRHLAVQPAPGRDLLRRLRLRRERRQALVRAGDERPAHLRDAALLRRHQAHASTWSTTTPSTSPPSRRSRSCRCFCRSSRSCRRRRRSSSCAIRSAPVRTSSPRGSRARASCSSGATTTGARPRRSRRRPTCSAPTRPSPRRW